jgi:hypothetical protein
MNMRPENLVGPSTSRDREVNIVSLRDTEFRIAVPGSAASRPRAEITAHIATSLEMFVAAQRQFVRQRLELE